MCGSHFIFIGQGCFKVRAGLGQWLRRGTGNGQVICSLLNSLEHVKIHFQRVCGCHSSRVNATETGQLIDPQVVSTWPLAIKSSSCR